MHIKIIQRVSDYTIRQICLVLSSGIARQALVVVAASAADVGAVAPCMQPRWCRPGGRRCSSLLLLPASRWSPKKVYVVGLTSCDTWCFDARMQSTEGASGMDVWDVVNERARRGEVHAESPRGARQLVVGVAGRRLDFPAIHLEHGGTAEISRALLARLASGESSRVLL